MSLSKNRRKVILLPLIMISLVCSVFSFSGLNSIQIGSSASAQITNSNPIQILSTSTNTDDLGNFHILGEVNNTSTQSQTNIAITALLSNATNNIVVGNYSAFTSIENLRTGELSPFDIIIQDPQQVLGKFSFMEFSTSSQPATDDKPVNFIINGSSSFLDNAGNPHITGNIINQGQLSEQPLNLVATFYDNSSLGVIGTQSFGLNAGNLASNQMVPFDITITDNKTKSQGEFYSLNVESSQSSMNLPLNTKTSFASSLGFASSSGADGLANGSPMNNPPVFVNNDDDKSRSGDNNDDNDDDGDDDGDNQRGEKKKDDEGNPWFDDNNCSKKSGSSGGSSSECEEAEKEEKSEAEDEDSLEKDQGPPSNSDSDSTNDNNDDNEDNSGESSDDENTQNNDDNSNGNDKDDANEDGHN